MRPIKIKHLPKASKLSLLISIYAIRVMSVARVPQILSFFFWFVTSKPKFAFFCIFPVTMDSQIMCLVSIEDHHKLMSLLWVEYSMERYVSNLYKKLTLFSIQNFKALSLWVFYTSCYSISQLNMNLESHLRF